jgi:hypothetical protein
MDAVSLGATRLFIVADLTLPCLVAGLVHGLEVLNGVTLEVCRGRVSQTTTAIVVTPRL